MIGLKKRPTYDELVNSLDVDQIKHYPDRQATGFENSNYMSQLALGFQEVTIQNDRMMKEKTKSILFQELGQASSTSHREMTVLSGAKTPSNIGSFGSVNTPQMDRPTFLPERDRGLLNSMFSDTFDAEHQQRRDQLHNALDMDQQQFEETVRFATQPLIQRHEQMERHYEDQLAFQSHEMLQERERHNQDRRNIQHQARSVLHDIYGQNMTRMIEAHHHTGSASSSSAAPPPMRLALQDLSPIEPIADSDDEDELIQDEPTVTIGKHKPKPNVVTHQFKPKSERAKKPRSHGERIYLDSVSEWQKESLAVLKEQISFRPDIKIKKSELNVITKAKAIFLLMDYDKRNPEK